MTTQLAIGYLAGARRDSPGARLPAGFAAHTGCDSLAARPAIPQAVITWSDAETAPAVGAGDPASAIAGPPAFTFLRDRSHRLARGRPLSLDAVLFSVLVATLAGLASAVLLHSGAQSNAWVSYETIAATGAPAASVRLSGVRVVDSASLLSAKRAADTAAN